MPHITVQMFPGRNDEIKKNLAEKLAKVASEELGRGIEHFSVSVEDIPQDEWKERVFNKIVDPDNKNIFVTYSFMIER